MDDNAFGKLVRTYRELRGWTQEELADRWGFTREYLSQIERGKRKLGKWEQVEHLADILGIPQERLVKVGKAISPKRRGQTALEGNDALIQALLEPAQATVRISELILHTNGTTLDIGARLRNWMNQLDTALTIYQGQFRNPTLRILAYIHEMLGKLAIERTATQEAIAHFQEMYDIAEELGDVNMLMIAQIHQSEMLRRRSRYEAAFRRMEATERYIQKHEKEVSKHIQGMMWHASAINYFTYGDERGFLRTIDRAAEIAEDTATTIDTVGTDFDKVEMLQLRAIGHTILWKPEKSLEIYKEIDTLREFRTLRDQASYHIIKAQSYCGVGDTETGIALAISGMNLAEELGSIRYVIRLLQMSDRLKSKPAGKEREMQELREEILGTLERMRKANA